MNLNQPASTQWRRVMNSREQIVRDIHAFVAGSDLDPHCIRVLEEAIEILDQHATDCAAIVDMAFQDASEMTAEELESHVIAACPRCQI